MSQVFSTHLIQVCNTVVKGNPPDQKAEPFSLTVKLPILSHCIFIFSS